MLNAFSLATALFARSSVRAMASLSTAAAPTGRVAVVGGGVTGLAAAKSLINQQVPCTLIDMGGRGVGGRVSSRVLELEGGQGPLSFDAGAQFFTAATPEFQRELAGWAAAGAAREWSGRHGRIAAGGDFELGQPGSSGGFFDAGSGQAMWVGTPTNGALMQHMAQELLAAAAQKQQQQQQQGQWQDTSRQQAAPLFELLSGVAVQSMERTGGGGCGGSGGRWALRGSRQGRAAAAAPAPPPGDQEDLGCYDAVILADAMPLLPGSAGHVAGIDAAASSLAQLARSVQAVAPQPCFALMVAFAQSLPGVPFDSATVEQPTTDCTSSSGSDGGSSSGNGGSGSSAFQWVACNSSKPGRPGGSSPQCWVALTTPQRAQHLLRAHPLIGPGGRFNPQTGEYRAAVAAELLADFRAFMQPFVQGALPEPVHVSAQRWGRAFVTEPLGAELLFLPAQRLALCSDVAAGGGVEAAWRSGRAAGETVGRMLRSA
ncbi:hypothetical protein ABPG75_000354 [Micractinium tetrahymenae]